jgi:DNA-binding CsgD family transcriptional regulator
MTAGAFYDNLDRMILSGARSYDVAKQFGIRERTVRRRKASLLSQGHVIASQGLVARVNHEYNKQ